MELTYDWKSFQSLFYVKKRLSPPAQQEPKKTPLYLIEDQNVIICAFAEGEDFSDWVGATCEELKAEYSHRELVFFKREQVDQWMVSAGEMVHFYDQIQYLRNESKIQENVIHQHFLLNAIQSWWQKLFPSTYGIYIRLDNNPATSIFLVIQRGRVDSFHIPDLSGALVERKRAPVDLVKYLSERYLVPVQGLFLTSAEWMEWSESSNPWPKIAKTLKGSRSKLAPFKWSFATLIAIRGYFGF